MANANMRVLRVSYLGRNRNLNVWHTFIHFNKIKNDWGSKEHHANFMFNQFVESYFSNLYFKIPHLTRSQ